MHEERVRMICTSSRFAASCTRSELAEADRWVRDYALDKLKAYLKGNANAVARDYIMLMATATYGSVETDKFLMAMKCYPAWLSDKAS